ncbi:MAG: AmmeMemoRadiSam system protein A [Coriobacteriia bacterium]|nr:AmmeMemoRadiSam system protein A [Coriobacteriia bacterium]MBS5478567.1 AmmeMemoRadiSam system protein A [Coriobacteriia bacterium]
MPIAAAFVVPHPPLALPGVGRGQERQIASTVSAYKKVAKRIAELKPDVLIVSSPHATSYYDYIHVSPGTRGAGDFSAYNDPSDRIEVAYDAALATAISKEASKARIPAGTAGERVKELDHGTMVPLYFIQTAGTTVPIVRIGISGLSALDHYRFGQCVARAIEKLGRRAVFVASGDLSHKLKKSGPYGFSAAGPAFDREICKILASGDFSALLQMDQTMCENAAECGLRSFQMMAGALDGKFVRSELLSHEGPFGVGYGVAAFEPLGPSPLRHFGDALEKQQIDALSEVRSQEDPYVRLARKALESWVLTKRRIKVSPDTPWVSTSETAGFTLPDDMLTQRSGVFVSIKKKGELRGCIGTLEATRRCVGDEIVENAISAGTRDPRFPTIKPTELKLLVYSVDVLGEPEVIDGPGQLDPARYGVIVSTCDGRRGVLLPDLEGIDTPEKQVYIARSKGGIDPYERVTLQRFEVVRHR